MNQNFTNNNNKEKYDFRFNIIKSIAAVLMVPLIIAFGFYFKARLDNIKNLIELKTFIMNETVSYPEVCEILEDYAITKKDSYEKDEKILEEEKITNEDNETTNNATESTEETTIENKINFANLIYSTIEITEETYSVEIKPNEIGALTCGPALINNVYLLGGANPDRGSVVILMPSDNKTTNYTINKLIPEHNWFGIYDVNEVNEFNLQYIINERIELMRKPPNGTSGLGCKIIDVLVVSGQNNLFNKSYQF